MSYGSQVRRDVVGFCREISDKATPLLVRVEAHPEAQFNECFFNVRSIVQKRGGQLIYGWTIWLWPKVWIEAEHHAVWEKPTKELVDVSPKADDESKIVFLPDPSATFDFQSQTSRDNIRKPLVDDDDVRAFFSFARQLYSLIADNKVGPPVTLKGTDIQTFKWLQSVLANLTSRIKARYG